MATNKNNRSEEAFAIAPRKLAQQPDFHTETKGFSIILSLLDIVSLGLYISRELSPSEMRA